MVELGYTGMYDQSSDVMSAIGPGLEIVITNPLNLCLGKLV